jgi:hypothetical protein
MNAGLVIWLHLGAPQKLQKKIEVSIRKMK